MPKDVENCIYDENKKYKYSSYNEKNLYGHNIICKIQKYRDERLTIFFCLFFKNIDFLVQLKIFKIAISI